MISNKDFIGCKFNDWEVIDWVKGKKEIEWICKCKCGKIKQQKVDNIKNGRSKKCKECSIKEKRKKEEPKKEKIIKIRFNNHLEWTPENTFTGTYKEYLNECKKRKKDKKNTKRKRNNKGRRKIYRTKIWKINSNRNNKTKKRINKMEM